MHIEFIGTPISKSAGNATAEIVQTKMTLDDGTTEITEGRAIQMRVGNLIIQAWTSKVKGETSLGLTTFRTLNVLGDGRLGKEVNVAVQSEQGELVSSADDHLAVTPVTFSSTQELADFIAAEVAKAAVTL
jgi:hypothetical protein